MPLETVGTPALWAGFIVFVLAMLVVDLGVFHRRTHAVSLKEAGVWSAVWVALALAFNAGVYALFGPERALEFTTGYLIEKALAVDNIFIFAVIFGYFAIPHVLRMANHRAFSANGQEHGALVSIEPGQTIDQCQVRRLAVGKMALIQAVAIHRRQKSADYCGVGGDRRGARCEDRRRSAWPRQRGDDGIERRQRRHPVGDAGTGQPDRLWRQAGEEDGGRDDAQDVGGIHRHLSVRGRRPAARTRTRALRPPPTP